MEFDVKYHPRLAIKAQALVDFVTECMIPKEEGSMKNTLADQEGDGSEDQWLLNMDGSSNTSGSMVGLILSN